MDATKWAESLVTRMCEGRHGADYDPKMVIFPEGGWVAFEVAGLCHVDGHNYWRFNGEYLLGEFSEITVRGEVTASDVRGVDYEVFKIHRSWIAD